MWFLLSTLAFAAEPPTVGADTEARAPRHERWDVSGSVRARHDLLRLSAIDELGTPADVSSWTGGRVTTRAAFTPERWALRLGAEALTGGWFGDATQLGLDATDRPAPHPRYGTLDRAVFLREAQAAWRGDRVQVQAGRTSFLWGTGMLANDGGFAARTDDAGFGGQDFGDPWSGSVVDRVALSATPWRPNTEAGAKRGLGMLMAFDRVVRDDQMDRRQGDRAMAVVSGVRWRLRRAELGGLVVRRWQQDGDAPTPLGATEPDRFTTRVLPVDVWATVELTDPKGSHHVTLEGEVAWIRGETTRVQVPETWDAPAEVNSLGGLARVRTDHDDLRLSTRLDFLYASGDNDPRDAVVRNFAFHTDYNAGMLLFEHVMPLLTARTADRVADPALLAVTPEGVRHTINPGAFTNAMALNPVVRWRPVDTLDVRLGWLAARGAGDVVDVYHSALYGGYNRTLGDGDPDDRGLGHELDLAIAWTARLPGQLTLTPGIEAAILRPGSALSALDLGTPALIRGGVDFRW